MIAEIESATPREYVMTELEQITILEKLKPSKNGKALPVLVKMNNEMEAKAVLRNATKHDAKLQKR